MKNKLLIGALSLVLSFVSTLSTAAASQIPAGYVLVPAETFFGGEMHATTASPEPVVSVSIASSSLRSNDEISYVGEKYSVITATLRDENNNPIANQNVNLISSRATDTVQAIQSQTNSNGEAVFQVIAAEEGVSAFTAVADNQTITERPRIVFLKKAGGIGGEFLAADALDTITSGLTTTDPTTSDSTVTTVVTNESGADDNIISTTTTGGYDLQITFPDQVIINTPSDITVAVVDASGNPVESFDGTISFTSSETLAILPSDYTFIKLDRGEHTFANAVTFTNIGQTTITINGDGVNEKVFSVGVVDNLIPDAEPPIVTSPSNGELINEATIFMGLTQPNSNLAIFDNGQLIKTGGSDVAGNFIIQTDLADGKHEIKVALLNADSSISATSEAIQITVDRTEPELKEISLFPSNKVITGESITVEVKSEPGLEDIEIVVNGSELSLDESTDAAGVYQGTFKAPAPGTYFLKLSMTDQADNIGEYPDATSILVEEERLQAQNCDQRVILNWERSTNPVVTNYRIDYGSSSNMYVETRMVPGGSATEQWEIGNLINGSTYFFSIKGLNDFGEAVEEIGDEVSAVPQSGLFCEVIDQEPIQLWQRTDADGNIVLVWNAANGASGYRVYAGTESGSFDLPTVETTETTYQPENLTPGEEYYFAVSAIYAGSHSAAALSNVAKVEVGPGEVLAVSLLVAIAGSWLIRRKRLALAAKSF